MLSLVCAVLAADPIWTETLGGARDRAELAPPPLASQQREAFDDLERAVRTWERERREMLDDQVIEQQRVAQRQRDEAPLPDAALRKYKVIDAGKGVSGQGRSRAKVIEVKRDHIEA